MTPEYLTNRLHFFSNAKTILAFLKSGIRPAADAPLFSLHTIKPQPPALEPPANEHVVALSELNMEAAHLDGPTRQIVLLKLLHGRESKPSPDETARRIEEIRKRAAAQPDDRMVREVEQAVLIYKQHNFFSLYDWRFKYWGTVGDIHSVTASTFELPTSFIEFTTLWTPPIAAMQALAEIFPSVRFELAYRFKLEDLWTRVEIFPARTFAY